MPGIFGVIGLNSPVERDRALQSMQECMHFEPFYHSGSWSHPDLEIALGWSGHRGILQERMPVWNERNDRCLVFCGEHFPHSQSGGALKEAAGAAGFLLAGYEREGKEFLTRLNGWFCGLIVDLRERLILLFNDRYGVSRIYFHETPNAFFFSSEPKALLQVCPETRSLDSQGLGEYLSCGCVLQDRTLFRGISTLPCGACWEFDPSRGRREWKYFPGEELERQDKISKDAFYERLRATWERILPCYLQSNEPVGLSLTGGVDSRMILAWSRESPGQLPCYTFCGNFRESNDVRLARELAKKCGQSHRVLAIDESYFSAFGKLAEQTIRISGGAMDVTGTLDLHLQRLAREVSPVRLSGVYGGEILRKLVVFKPMPVDRKLWDKQAGDAMDVAAVTYREELKAHPVSFSAFKQAPWHMTAKFSIERSQVTFRTPFFDNELVALCFQAPDEAVSSNEVSLRLVSDGNPALNGIETDRGLTLGTGERLGKARYLIQQFLFKAEYAYDYGMPQWLARMDHVAAPMHLERLFLGRHGPSHFRVWYRDQLAAYVKEVLLDPRSLGRPYLEKGKVEALLNRHLSGSGNFTLEIHKLLSLELIHRQLLEAS